MFPTAQCTMPFQLHLSEINDCNDWRVSTDTFKCFYTLLLLSQSGATQIFGGILGTLQFKVTY